MVRKIHVAAVVMVIAVSAVIFLYIYNEFRVQREMNRSNLDMVKFSFEITSDDAIDIIDVNVLRYSDVTFLGFTILVGNQGSEPISFETPVLQFYLEGIPAVETDLDDFTLAEGESREIVFEDLSFKSEVIDEAVKKRSNPSDSTLLLTANFSSTYEFSLGGNRLKDYRLVKSFTGSVLLTEIFGGKTQEEAADEILGQRLLS